MADDNGYLLDNARAEAGTRLTALSVIFDPPTFRRLDDLGIAPGWRCWEVGAGGPSVPRWLAGRVGEAGRVLATDIDVSWLGAAADPAAGGPSAGTPEAGTPGTGTPGDGTPGDGGPGGPGTPWAKTSADGTPRGPGESDATTAGAGTPRGPGMAGAGDGPGMAAAEIAGAEAGPGMAGPGMPEAGMAGAGAAVVEVRRHDVARDEPPGETFDLVHARLVLVHLADRDRALRSMISVLRPGGVLFLEDADPALQPLAAPYEQGPRERLANRIRTGFRAMLAERGADLAYGRRLPTLLREAGLTGVAAEAYFPIASPACAVLESATIAHIRDGLVRSGRATEEEIERHLANVAAGGMDLATAPMVSAWGRRPR